MRRTVVLDTNILVYFFDGNIAAGNLLSETEYYVSAATYIEILSDKKTTLQKRLLIHDFLLGTTVVHTSPPICDIAAKLRLSYSIKLPDAIIAATAIYLDLPLVTADAELFKIKETRIEKFFK